MKKRIVAVLLTIMIVCGCGNKDPYKNYERYDLKEDNLIIYDYFYGREKATYAVGLLEDNSELDTIGFFYKVKDNDYILLDQFYEDKTSVITLYNNYNDDTFQFYDNNLFYRQYYTITKYTLNHEEIEKEEIKFDTKAELATILQKANEYTEDNLRIRCIRFIGIEKIEDNYIYLKSVIDNVDYKDFISKCSLENLICEEVTS